MRFQNKDAIVGAADGTLPLARESGLPPAEQGSENKQHIVRTQILQQSEVAAPPAASRGGHGKHMGNSCKLRQEIVLNLLNAGIGGAQILPIFLRPKLTQKNQKHAK